MLHFVIAAAIVVGVWYQWILPERRRKALQLLTVHHLHPQGSDFTSRGRRGLNQARRRAGFPVLPEPPPAPRPLRPYQSVVRRPLTPRQAERRGVLQWSLCSGAVTALVLTAYSLIAGG